jgi:mRNA-degrading endonuclease RelE of RelBE toxin-antitoxin system
MAPMLPLTRVRAMPWLLVFELAMTARKHWKRLDPKDRSRLAELLKKSQGRPNRLSPRERAEVRELVAKLEPGAFARSVVPLGRKAAKGRRR